MHTQVYMYLFGSFTANFGIFRQTALQGSSAFVYGWVAFADRLSNGIAVKIVQQFLPLQQSRYYISLNYECEQHKCMYNIGCKITIGMC